MISDAQRYYIVELLEELETAIRPGEYYSLDPRFFTEYVAGAEKLFGIKYVFSDDDWRTVDGEVVHKHDSYFRRRWQ
jgi:hypothetical protein